MVTAAIHATSKNLRLQKKNQAIWSKMQKTRQHTVLPKKKEAKNRASFNKSNSGSDMQTSQRQLSSRQVFRFQFKND